MRPADRIKPLHAADGADEFRKAHSAVATYSPMGSDRAHSHEDATRAVIGRSLATLKGCDFAQEYDPSRHYPGRVYLVPGNTLVGLEAARSLGIHTEHDLFGGVVSHPFVATKSITHPLVEPEVFAPDGWSHAFAERVRDVVLSETFAAFTLQDARRAGQRLLQEGSVRIKPARGIGGRGQVVATRPAELEAVLSKVDAEELACYGLVLEQDLANVTTYSVGQVRVGGIVATYCGKQRLTNDNAGAVVYGGSDLVVVRGDYNALLELGLAPGFLRAVIQAQKYDAATEEFPGLFASRRNYDVAQGFDCQGRWRSGVLEQSWRIGGASGPEVAALQAFCADPALRVVHAWCLEIFGECAEPPANAIVHFQGVDDRTGPITKYTLVEAYDPAR